MSTTKSFEQFTTTKPAWWSKLVAGTVAVRPNDDARDLRPTRRATSETRTAQEIQHNIAVKNHATAWNAVHHFIVHANARACGKRIARVGLSVANKRGFGAVGGNDAGDDAIQTCGGSSSHACDSGGMQCDGRNATRLRHVLNFLRGARFTCSAASWSQIARVIIWYSVLRQTW